MFLDQMVQGFQTQAKKTIVSLKKDNNLFINIYLITYIVIMKMYSPNNFIHIRSCVYTMPAYNAMGSLAASRIGVTKIQNAPRDCINSQIH